MAAIQSVDLGKSGILAEQISQGAAQKPLAMQAPLASRGRQAIRDQHKQDLAPSRPLAAHSQPLAPELIELQLPPQHQCQPARAPLSRPAQPRLRESDPDDPRVTPGDGVRQQPLAAVFGKQRQRPRAGLAILENLNRPPPRQLLRIVDLAQLQHVALHHAAVGNPRVFNNAPVAMLLAILPANLETQEHDGRELSARSRP